jgi:hypothetical protein
MIATVANSIGDEPMTVSGHGDERIAPAGPDLGQPYPEQVVNGVQMRAAPVALALEH